MSDALVGSAGFALPSDGGSAALVQVQTDPDGRQIVHVSLEADPRCEAEGADFRQHFDFRLSGPLAKASRVVITNAGDAMCGAASFDGYEVCASSDEIYWQRIQSTHYDASEAKLVIDLPAALTSSGDGVHLAYFVPYPLTRHNELLQCAADSPLCTLVPLMQTPGGRSLDVLHVRCADQRVGAGAAARLQLWLLARQHPSETAAEWWAEGLLNRLLGLAFDCGPNCSAQGNTSAVDRSVESILSQCDVHIVPNMNPDGSVQGHTRSNAYGVNLNRMWAEPTAEESPEVLAVRDLMDELGVDMVLDVHQDESLSSGAIACVAPAWTPRLERLQRTFASALSTRAGDLFDEAESEQYLLFAEALRGSTEDSSQGGRMDRMGSEGANLTLCTTQVGARFDCLAVTIEQPFKPVLVSRPAQPAQDDKGTGVDAAASEQKRVPWDVQCSRDLGSATLDAIADILHLLREPKKE